MKEFFALILLILFAVTILFVVGIVSLAAYKIHPLLTVMILFTTLVVSVTTPIIPSVKLTRIFKRG